MIIILMLSSLSMTYKDMETFVDLLKTSTLVQAIITLLCIGTIAYLYIAERQVPDTLVSIVMLILGYYFGSKSEQQIRRAFDRYVAGNEH